MDQEATFFFLFLRLCIQSNLRFLTGWRRTRQLGSPLTQMLVTISMSQPFSAVTHRVASLILGSRDSVIVMIGFNPGGGGRGELSGGIKSKRSYHAIPPPALHLVIHCSAYHVVPGRHTQIAVKYCSTIIQNSLLNWKCSWQFTTRLSSCIRRFV